MKYFLSKSASLIFQSQTTKLSMQKLSTFELKDYLNGVGAWRPKHKFDPPKNEDDNQYIPNEPINNFNLGFLISNIIDLKYPQREPLKVPEDIPNYLPLKLLCLGYDFSGKNTLCSFLNERYGIEVLRIDEILNEAIDLVSIF